MQLNRSELARAFNVSLNIMGNWVIRDCPRISAGGPGVPSVFEFRAVAAWIARSKGREQFGKCIKEDSARGLGWRTF